MGIVAIYLFAIIGANLSTAHFGPSAAVVNAFLFIGLDLSSRDSLHDRWNDDHLRSRMALLITFGSALSWLVNRGAGRIALASLVAFGLAAVADTVFYVALHRRQKLTRINGSNLASAAVDSVVFPALAFGLPLLPEVMLGQFVAKILGGFVWSILLLRASSFIAVSVRQPGTNSR